MSSPWQESRRNSTFAKVTFHSFDFGTIDGYAGPLDGIFGGKQRTLTTRRGQLVGDIASFTTTKQLAGDGGSWSVTCKGKVYGDIAQGGKTWSAVIRDGDWATINVVKNGAESHLMVGRVDTVAVAIQAGGHGEPDVTVTLTGRDSTAAPIDTPLHFNPYDPLHNNAAGIDMVKLFGDVFAGAPNECVPRILTAALGDNGANFGHPPLVPPGVVAASEAKWSDGVDIVARVAKCRGFLFAPALLNMGQVQSLWQLANQYANPAFNELWLDTDPEPGSALLGRKVYLNFRERPFVNTADGSGSPWYKLTEHIAPLSTVQAINLSRGRNRVNYVQFLGAFASIFQSDAMALAPPSYNEESIKRWGLRKLEMSSTYLSEESEGGADNWAAENRKWRDLLVAWNALNADYWEGTVMLAELRPEIRVGSKLVLTGGPPAGYTDFPHDGGDPAEAMTFYVEAVQHTWAAGQTPTAQTQLLLTHGYVEKSRLPDLTAALAKWKDVVGTEGAKDDSTLGDYPTGDADATRYA
jgi:hypothetical protein